MSAATALVVQAPQRVSITAAMADRYGMDPAAFEQTLRATVMPSNTSKEQFAAFLLVAKEHNLNPVTREIYAMPAKSGGIQPIVSIDGWLNLMNSHPQMDGLEFEDSHGGDGKLVAITARIWRKDRERPVVVTEYMSECRRDTPTWRQWPARMLRHKAAIQAARYAFGFAGIVEPDEYERGNEAQQARRAPPPAPPLREIGSRAASPPPAPTAGASPEPPRSAPVQAQPAVSSATKRAGPPSPPPARSAPEPPRSAPVQAPPAVSSATKRAGPPSPPPARSAPAEIIVEPEPPDEASVLGELEADLGASGDEDTLGEVWVRFEGVADGISRNGRERAAALWDQHLARIRS